MTVSPLPLYMCYFYFWVLNIYMNYSNLQTSFHSIFGILYSLYNYKEFMTTYLKCTGIHTACVCVCTGVEQPQRDWHCFTGFCIKRKKVFPQLSSYELGYRTLYFKPSLTHKARDTHRTELAVILCDFTALYKKTSWSAVVPLWGTERLCQWAVHYRSSTKLLVHLAHQPGLAHCCSFFSQGLWLPHFWLLASQGPSHLAPRETGS